MSIVLEFHGGPFDGKTAEKEWERFPPVIEDRNGLGRYKRTERIETSEVHDGRVRMPGFAYVWEAKDEEALVVDDD